MPQYTHTTFNSTNNLDRRHKGRQRRHGFLLRRRTRRLVLASGVNIGRFNGLEKGRRLFLLFGRLCQESYGTARLSHVTIQLGGDFEPGLLFNEFGQLVEAFLGFRQDGLFAADNGRIGGVEEGSITGFSIDRVGRIELGGLVRSVRGPFRVRRSVSNQSKDGESGGFTDGGIGSGRKKGNTECGGSGRDNVTAGCFL